MFSRKRTVSVKVAISMLTGLEGLYSRITAFSKCEEELSISSRQHILGKYQSSETRPDLSGARIDRVRRPPTI